ncbi:MAG: NUDIX domain-containing protein [bacterium]
MIVVTVGGLIKYDDYFLFVRTNKWNGKWGIPGGKIKQGETLIKALIREIKEETNLNIQPKNCFYLTFFESIFDPEFYKPIHMILFNYLVKVDNISNIKLNSEISEYKLLKLNQINSIELNKYTKELIKFLLRHKKELLSKSSK